MIGNERISRDCGAHRLGGGDRGAQAFAHPKPPDARDREALVMVGPPDRTEAEWAEDQEPPEDWFDGQVAAVFRMIAGAALIAVISLSIQRCIP